MNTKIGFLYPGQGAQFVGMMKDFYLEFDIAKKICKETAAILGFDITKIMFEGPEEELKESKNAQIAIMLHSIIINSLLNDLGIKPSYLAGHSLGEYSALVCGKSLSLEDGLRIIQLRGRLMSEASINRPGKMVAIIGLEKEKVENICREVSENGKIVNISNYNSPLQIVISGEPEATKKAVELANVKGAKRCVFLPVSGAFHSPLMQEANEKFQAALDEINIADSEIPIIANTSAKIISTKDEIKEELKRHMLSPVNWCDSIRKMIDLEIETFIEVGPGKILKGLLLQISDNKKIYSTYDLQTFQYTVKTLEF